MQPTSNLDRIPMLDALRGFALCGILLANLLSFTGAVYITVDDLSHTDWLTRSVLFAIDFFVEGKFYSLFSILFGIGCAIQWQRISSQGTQFVSLWYRRMGILLIIGLVHMYLIWYGDILTLYACLGLLLPLLIKLNRTLMLRLIILLLVLPLVIFAVRYFTADAPFWYQSASVVARLHQAWGLDDMSRIAMFTSDNPIIVLQSNITGALQRPMSYLQTGRVFKVLGQFLFGFWVGCYLFPQLHHRWTPQTKVVIGLVIVAIACNLIYAGIKNIFASPFMLTPIGVVQALAYHIGSTTMAICYILAMGYIWRQGRLRKFFDPLILLGRMSLTNYLGQSVIGILIFYGYGFSLMGETPFSLVPVIAGFILLIQWQSSKFWLQRYPHGPIETLWRWSTYARFPATKSSFNHD
ncbi:MAG: hypothetical protein ACI9Y1_001891 [Lentisphaeria bacterium]|jgi:uncharacterized protein